jgi:hypothetical protein
MLISERERLSETRVDPTQLLKTFVLQSVLSVFPARLGGLRAFCVSFFVLSIRSVPFGFAYKKIRKKSIVRAFPSRQNFGRDKKR